MFPYSSAVTACRHVSGWLIIWSLITPGIHAKVPCELYLADSTIPGAGLGIFTAIEKKKGSTVGNADVCLPLVDIYWHNDDTWPSIMADYVWDGRGMGMGLEVEGTDINAYWPGLDCAINCNLALLNVDKASPVYDEAGLHRSRHPGAGAISLYNGKAGSTRVIKDIPAGGELFKYYGDTWFTTRYNIFGNIPLWEDYEEALKLLQKMTRVKAHLWSNFYNTLLDMRGIWDSRTLNAFPDTLAEALEAASANDIGVVHQPSATRSQDWLEENGVCIDHIGVGPSTIEGAGRGAFAKHALPEGTLVTSSPLHHVADLKMFNIYETDLVDGTNERTDEVIGKQVALNYCFGHPESTLLLCPYGSGVNYINHNRTKANVRIAWAKDGSTSQNDAWFDISPLNMVKQYSTNLAFNYIATRDIEEGEELFLDYGDDWEKAWLEHVKAWEPSPHWADYMSATQFNSVHGAEPVRTVEEQEEAPYPDNLAIHCHSFLRGKAYAKKPPKDANDPRLAWTNDDKGYPCQVLERDDEKDLYVVELFLKSHVVTREDVFRQAISFMDVPYSTDMHLVRAFRQPLGIPDEMVPETWKNARDTESSE